MESSTEKNFSSWSSEYSSVWVSDPDDGYVKLRYVMLGFIYLIYSIFWVLLYSIVLLFSRIPQSVTRVPSTPQHEEWFNVCRTRCVARLHLVVCSRPTLDCRLLRVIIMWTRLSASEYRGKVHYFLVTPMSVRLQGYSVLEKSPAEHTAKIICL